MTGFERLLEALFEKGYRCLGQTIPKHKTDPTQEFRTYSDEKTVLIVQLYKLGGFELYRPVCEANSVDETIAAIP